MNVLCSTTPFDYPNTLAIDPNLSINAIGGIDPGSGNWTNISQIPNLIFPPPIDKKRYYLDKLADLNCTLLKYVADTNSSSPAEASITHEEASVGQVLEFLEEFHGILKYYLLTIPIRSAPRLSGSDPEDTDYDSEPDFAENGTAAGQPLISLVTESHEARGMDYPTVLAISTCYVSLVRLCRSWLQNMTAILEESDHRTKHHTTASQSHHLGNLEGQDCRPSSAFSGHPVSNIPHVLPGVQLGGFQLGNYRSLQISVFMQVSMDLLWRIERAVAALVATDSIGLPASSKNLSTIKTMLQQEARASHRTTPRQQQRKPKDQGAIGVQSLMVLVRTVRKSLRGNVCLQLEEGSLDWDDFVL
ncbi:hypothetical protein H2200_003398 [Cladophialophora chaetospira]|uniref:Uncharacterized protein n=1 Tax=Cladophialophora chaetospira TaxID=386627 RepID=A0AA38XHZ6_9EURO|nr:hypothetical protein H2200_003398 [Cladophialophora chaetospira]